MKKKYRSFKEAREFARSLGLKNTKEWREYNKSGKRPNDLPKAPEHAYKNKGWTTWGDFLGTGNVREKDFLPFEEAREFVRSLGLKGQKEWAEYSKSGKKPDDIPGHPWNVYSKERLRRRK